MEAANMFEEISTAIERVLKAGEVEGVAKTKEMTREGLVTHALTELRKAAAEPRPRGLRRLAVLGKAVAIAKENFVDTESESIQVPIFEEDTTAAADETETEMSPLAIEPAAANAAFASNPEELTKALSELKKKLEGLRGSLAKGKPAETAEPRLRSDGWPLDMNTKQFREDVSKKNNGPDWGFDPGFELSAKP